MLRMGVDTYLITAHTALLPAAQPRGLLVEMTDGTAEVNANYRERVGFLRPGQGEREPDHLAHRRAARPAGDGAVCHARVAALEAMLEGFGVTEATWRDALARVPGFG